MHIYPTWKRPNFLRALLTSNLKAVTCFYVYLCYFPCYAILFPIDSAHAHLYYSVGVNWYQNVRPAISAVLPIPQRYYVPERLRNSYKPRLMAAGLWITSSEAENEGSRSAFQKIPKRKAKESQAKQKAKTALEREKVTYLRLASVFSISCSH